MGRQSDHFITHVVGTLSPLFVMVSIVHTGQGDRNVEICKIYLSFDHTINVRKCGLKATTKCMNNGNYSGNN